MQGTRGRSPKYQLIRDDLMKRIEGGEFTAGDALPPQRSLSEEYGVSLMTLRQALDELCTRGIVEQQPGKGTFVKLPPVPYSMNALRSLADDLRSQGIPISTKVVSEDFAQAPAGFAERLGVPEGSQVLVLERVRWIRNSPLIHQLSYIPQPFADTLRGCDFKEYDLYQLFAEHCGVQATYARETIAPALIGEPVATALQCPPGSLALKSERLTRDADDTPLVIDVAVLSGDSVLVTNEREASGHRVSYAMGTPST